MINSPSQKFQKDEVIFLAGDTNEDLYYIFSGKVLVCLLKSSQVTALSILGEGEFLGEFSYFDNEPRSAHVIALEETEVITISHADRDNIFPEWLLTLARSLTKKLRNNDELIRRKGIRKKNAETIQALSIDEQRHYYNIIQEYKKLKNQ